MNEVRVDPHELLDELEKIFDSDPDIEEVGFIHPAQFCAFDVSSTSSATTEPKPAGATSNDNYFLNREHKLGISTLNLFLLYNAAKDSFFTSYRRYKISSETPMRKVNKMDEVSALEIDVMKHSRALLLLSCDFGTAWNSRKMIVSRTRCLPMLMEELHLSALVLSYSPKSERAWSHRRWVIKMIAKDCESIQGIVGKESEFVKTIVEKFKMNYRAWSHRCWLVSYMSDTQVLHELESSRDWAGLHVADNSCFHYRGRLLSKIVENVKHRSGSEPFSCVEFQRLWKEELDWIAVLIRRYVGREALWLHRRFLSLIWLKHLANADDQVAPCNSENVSTFVKDELLLFRKCSVIPDNDFEDYQAQATHSATYIAWLSKQIHDSLFIELKKGSHYETLKQLLIDNGKSFLWDSITPSCRNTR